MPPRVNKTISNYWMEHYVSENGLCSLCGNSGYVDTRGTAISPLGISTGRVNYCICPNGQTMRTVNIKEVTKYLAKKKTKNKSGKNGNIK